MIRSAIRKVGRKAKAVLREAREYAAVVALRRGRGVPVLIFAQGRTGSTLLESLIVGSGHFVGKGEILARRAAGVMFPLAYVRGMAKRHGKRNFVAHVKIYNITHDREKAGARPLDPGAFLRELAAAGWRIIWLRREDRVRHFVSNQVARARGHFQKLDDRREDTRITIERERLVGTVRWRERMLKEEQRALEGLDYLEIVYERDLQDPERHQATLDRIMDYLGLERRPARTRLRKINARPLREVIANYDEFAAWARELGWTDADEPAREPGRAAVS